MSILSSCERQKKVNTLHQLVNEVRGNEWDKVIARVKSNPEEVSVQGVYFNLWRGVDVGPHARKEHFFEMMMA